MTDEHFSSTSTTSSSLDSDVTSATSMPLSPPPSCPGSDNEMYALYVQIDRLRGNFQKDFAPSYPWYPILEELVRTEDQYLSDISSIVQYYIPKFSELQQELPDLVTAQTSQEIFINLEAIKDFHERFNQELKPLLGSNSLENVGKLFQDEAENFKIYSDYCSNHPKSVDLLVKLTKNKSIDSHLKSVQVLLQHPLNLSTYLLKPVQRVLKYKLLLQSMLKHCEEGTESHAMLTSASERMDFITREINELKAISENKQMLEEIQFGLDTTPFKESLNDFGTIHLQDTMLDLKAAKARQERMVILMDNALLICKVRDKQVRNARSTGKTLRGKKSPYKFKDLIKMTELTFTQDDHVKKDDQAFLVHKQCDRTKTTYCLRAKSVMKKNHWVSTLQDLVLSSFHFAPGMLQQIMSTLRYSAMSLNSDDLPPLTKFESLGRNMKLIPITPSVDPIEEIYLSDDEDTKRPQSMYDIIDISETLPSKKVSNISGDLYCESAPGVDAKDEILQAQVRRYSKNLERRPRPLFPVHPKKKVTKNERDSGISDSYSNTQVKLQMRELLSTMQQDYVTFQDSTRERDSGVEEVSMPSQLDFMSLKRKHEGLVQSLVRNYMNNVSEQNERSAQQESDSPLPRRHSRDSVTPKVPPIQIPSNHPYACKKQSDPYPLLSPSPSPSHSSNSNKPPLSPKPQQVKVLGSPHHKAKLNSRTLPTANSSRPPIPAEMMKNSSESHSSASSLSPGGAKEVKSKVSGMTSQWENTIDEHRKECQK